MRVLALVLLALTSSCEPSTDGLTPLCPDSGAECGVDRSCPFTQACRCGVCVNGCSADAECGEERVCAARLCLYDAECRSDADCTEPERCVVSALEGDVITRCAATQAP